MKIPAVIVKNKDIFFSLISLIIFISFLFFIYKTERSFSINPANQQEAEAQLKAESIKISPISGLECENYNRRPIAVMIANDSVARPLSGLTEADIVFEMQVVEDGITRLMAVFVCGSPDQIGSIRSARHDFIPLAIGLDAIYAHWGGSHFALDMLRNKIIDNLDALTNPYNTFYRSAHIWAPHNGFTSMERLVNSATKLGYRTENRFEGYRHAPTTNQQQTANNKKIKIPYTPPYNVEYQYDAQKNAYLRFRGGKPEVDKNNNQQVEAKNIVVMRAKSKQIEGQYNDVEVEGIGVISVYQNGEEIRGAWQKDKAEKKSKLYFFDEKGEEIKFVPGQIWVEIIEPEKRVEWITE